MPEDSFTEVSNESWFSRIGSAFKGILVGLLLFVIAFPLLFWNEGRAVKRYKTLKEGSGAVISVVADNIDPGNSDRLIHITGKAETGDVLTDSVFGVSANALKLKRVSEMYQWNEISESKTEKKLGGGTETVTTYSYSKTWSENPISSSSFKKPEGHQNPGEITYKSKQQVAGDVTLGAFTLSSSLVSQINNYESLPVESDSLLPESLKEKVKLHNAGFYFGADPASPQVGDTRVVFMMVRHTQVSVIAKQVGNTFGPYGTETGGSIELIQLGVHSPEAMIQKAQESNKILTWILRVAGFLLMLTGLNMILRPLSVLADVLPILGTIVGAGTGIISFLIAIVLSLITIAIAWFVYRPIYGIILILLAGGLTVAIQGKLKSASSTASA